MAVEMIMPKVDMDQETGTVVEWIKSEGQQVQEGEVILVIETDKIAIDVESPGTGILGGISAQPGEVVPIGKVIAYILEEGEKIPEPAREEIPTQPEMQAEPGQPDSEIAATPVARNLAEAEELNLSGIQGTGKGGRITKQDVQSAVSKLKTRSEGPVAATPSARRLARLSGVDLRQISGSGPAGRIQAADVEGFQPAPPAEPLRRSGDSFPLIGKRRTIAERVTASYQSIPHIQLTARADMTAFNQARAQLNQQAQQQGGRKISVTDLLTKLVAVTLTDHPLLNSSLEGDQILLHSEINIGLAVALDEGLIVPVINNADQKSVSTIAAEASDLITRARENTLTSADVRGGTFTITNLGPFGVEQFNAIINPPEAAILAVGATTREVAALEEQAIAVRPVMRFTLSADHRIIDGAVAARFIADLKSNLEKPILMTK